MAVFMTVSDWLAAAGVLIQLLLFGGLVWYCFETRQMRIAAEAQLEALHTPCVTFVATPREGADAVLEADGARGAMVLDFIAGDAMLINIGNGPAVNISYVLTARDNAHGAPDGYVSSIPPRIRASVPISRSILRGRRFDCLIQYESLSRRRYETRLGFMTSY
jgi:hypothetical protein